MTTNKHHTVETQMLIRKPVAEVFRAMIDPSITTNFWFTKSSGMLEEGKTVTWAWEMYNVSAGVRVMEILPEKRISIRWGEPYTTVDFEYIPISENSTYVTIRNYGFRETGDELIAVIKDSTGGFSMMLAGMKAYLEHGLKLNLTGDKYPAEVASLLSD